MMIMVCQNTECDITFIHQVDNVELKLWALEERESVQRGLKQQLRRTLDVFSMCNVKVYSEGESSCSWLDSRPCKPGLSREA